MSGVTIAKKIWAVILILSFVFPLGEIYAQASQNVVSVKKKLDEDRGYKQGVFNLKDNSGREVYIKTVVPKEAVDTTTRYDLQLDLADFRNSSFIPGLVIEEGKAFYTNKVTIKAGGLCCEKLEDLKSPPILIEGIEKTGTGHASITHINCFNMPEDKYEIDVDQLYCAYEGDQAEIVPISFHKRWSERDNKEYYCMAPVYCAKVDELALIYEMVQPGYDYINNKKNPRQRRTVTEIMPDKAKINYTSQASPPYYFEGSVDGMKEHSKGNTYAVTSLFHRANRGAIRASIVALMSMYESSGVENIFNLHKIQLHRPVCDGNREQRLREYVRKYYKKDQLSEGLLNEAIRYYLAEFECPKRAIWEDVQKDTQEVKTAIAIVNEYCDRKAKTLVASYDCVVPPKPAAGAGGYANIGAGASTHYGCNPSSVTKQIRNNEHHTINYNAEVELAKMLFGTRYGRLFITDTFKDKLGTVDFNLCDGSKTIDNFEVKEHYELEGEPLLKSDIDVSTVIFGIRDLRNMIIDGLTELLEDQLEVNDVMSLYANSEDWNFLDYISNSFIYIAQATNPLYATTIDIDQKLTKNHASKLVKYLKGYPYNMKQYNEATHEWDPEPNSREFLLTLERIEELLYNDQVDLIKDYIIYGATAVVALVALCTGASAPFGVTLATFVASGLMITNAGYNISQAQADSLLYGYGGAAGAKDLYLAYEELERELDKIDENIEMLIWEGAGLSLAMIGPFIKATKNIYNAVKLSNFAKKYNNLDDFTRVLITGELRAKSINNKNFIKYLNEDPIKRTEFFIQLGQASPKNAKIIVKNLNNIDAGFDDLMKSIFKVSDDVVPSTHQSVTNVTSPTGTKVISDAPSGGVKASSDVVAPSVASTKASTVKLTTEQSQSIKDLQKLIQEKRIAVGADDVVKAPIQKPRKFEPIKDNMYELIAKSQNEKVYILIDRKGAISTSNERYFIKRTNPHFTGKFIPAEGGQAGEYVFSKSKGRLQLDYKEQLYYSGSKKGPVESITFGDETIILSPTENHLNIYDRIRRNIFNGKHKIGFKVGNKTYEFEGYLTSPDELFLFEHVSRNIILRGSSEEVLLIKYKGLTEIRDESILLMKEVLGKKEYKMVKFEELREILKNDEWQLLLKDNRGKYGWKPGNKIELGDNIATYDDTRRLLHKSESLEPTITDMKVDNMGIREIKSSSNKDFMMKLDDLLNKEKLDEISVYVVKGDGTEGFIPARDFMDNITTTNISTIDAQRAPYLYTQVETQVGTKLVTKEVYVFGEYSPHPKANTEAATFQPFIDAIYSKGKGPILTQNSFVILLLPSSVTGGFMID